MLDRIVNYIKKDELTVHQKAVNIWLLYNKREDFPKLPPDLCPCKITTFDGKQYSAYIDTQVSGNHWVEWGNTLRIHLKGRRNWHYAEVKRWEFI